MRGIFFDPRRFYVNFEAEGSLREPVLFVLFVSGVSAVLRFLIELVFSAGGLGEAGIVALEALAYVALSPLLVGVLAGVYLLSVRTFVGPVGNLRQVYRILAYAWGASILFWIPGLNAVAFTYAALVLAGTGIRYAYRTSFLTALITALVGYVPAAFLFILLTILGVSVVAGRPGV